jgi:hypothetical protein
MNSATRDIFEVRVDETRQPSLLLRVAGPDRPNLIAEVASRLEEHRLLIETITFNLSLAHQPQYVMEIVARGDVVDVREIDRQIAAGEFPQVPSERPRTFHWPSAHMLHLAMNTPDAVGLTAKVARIVGADRDTRGRDVCPRGSFVHLMALLHNSGGPAGGTPYFALRANIAAETTEILDEIAQHIEAWAAKNERDRDVWTCRLDHD